MYNKKLNKNKGVQQAITGLVSALIGAGLLSLVRSLELDTELFTPYIDEIAATLGIAISAYIIGRVKNYLKHKDF